LAGKCPASLGSRQVFCIPTGRKNQINGVIVDEPYKNMLNVGDRSVSQERRGLRDRLSDVRNAQYLFKRLLGKCNDSKIDPLALFVMESVNFHLRYILF